jgi:outer membrane protein assembly factor BamD
MYYKFDSAYKLAMNSVKWKQTERVEKALTFYNSLLYVFPETQNNEEIQAMYEALKSIQTNSTTTKS